MTIDVTGVEHFDEQGNPVNTVLIEAVGDTCVMTGIAWDVTITTVGVSWLSEAVVYLDDIGQDGMGLFVTPGVGDTMPGIATYNSGGIIDLTDNGIPNITFAVDGDLYMEFHESLVDNPGAADSTYDPTSIYDIAGISCGGLSVGTADLAVTNDSGLVTATPGSPVSYNLIINLGPEDVDGATVEDVFPADLTAVSWTCAASPGASCTAG